MLRFGLDPSSAPLRQVLCIGAHCDDIEIGAGGTILSLAQRPDPPEFTWLICSSDATREAEALHSATRFLGRARSRVIIKKFRDGFLPYEGGLVKDTFEELKAVVAPDLVLTHYRDDLHQDHRLVAELTWNTFRNHLILEYEIPKYDGDLGTPNVFVPLDGPVATRKIELVLESFPSQRGKRWFSEDLFRSLLRLRGMEANAASDYAEAFYGRKVILDPSQRVG